MGIQDLGAIGEFISSIIIAVTLIVLIYEVRGTKRATLRANALEVQRARNENLRSTSETADLASIITSANHHLGLSLDESAAEFGLEPEQYRRLTTHFLLILYSWEDFFNSDLPPEEKERFEGSIRGVFLSNPAFKELYDRRSTAPDQASNRNFLNFVDEIRSSVEPSAS
jgi:hypothetical protein